MLDGRIRGVGSLRVLVAFVLAMSVWATDAVAATRIAYTRRTLDNGLEVICHRDARVPIVAVNLRYRLGSMHDPADARGLAHTVEHLMFRGSEHVGDGEHFLHLQRVGGVGSNASTDASGISFVETVPPAALETALWLESDRMGFFAPTEAAVRAEIETVGHEWATRIGSEPRAELIERVWSTMFPADHPLHHETSQSVKRVTLTRVQTFARTHLGPANAILVLAGDLPADTDALVDRYFGPLKGGSAPAPARLEVALDREVRIRPEKSLTRTPIVFVGWTTPGLYADGDAEADVLAWSLNNEVFESTARALGRDPSAIVVFEAQQVSILGRSAFFLAASGLPETSTSELLGTIDAVLDAIAQRGLPPADIRRARKRLRMGLLPALQTMEGRAELLATYAAAGRDPDGVDEDLARYDGVTPMGVAAFVKTHLPADRRVVLLNEGGR